MAVRVGTKPLVSALPATIHRTVEPSPLSYFNALQLYAQFDDVQHGHLNQTLPIAATINIHYADNQ
ncbi:MAG: hypothetical protein EAZ50_08315 [Runella slithyformis]|nr:MAG: hypothetical protein EAY79_09290 [Runella slithyformis]TAF80615.1 MAG: hypothetical protein EAZ50_08315 [Runella slithyformis]